MNIPNKSAEIVSIYSEIESEDKEFLIGNELNLISINQEKLGFDISYNNSKVLIFILFVGIKK